MNWQDKNEVMTAKVIGEMADILIKAMDWEKEYDVFKEKMFEYIKNSIPNKQ